MRPQPHPPVPAQAPTAAPAPGHDVDFRLLQLAYERLPLSLLLTGLVTLFFAGLMWDLAPPRLNLIWVGLIGASVALRGALALGWRHSAAPAQRQEFWRLAYLAGTLLAGVGWTTGPVLMVLGDGGAATALLVATLLSVCAVAMNALGSQRLAMQGFIVTTLGPFSVAVYFSASPVATLLALVLWAGLASLLIVGRASHRGMRELLEVQAMLGATAEEARAARQRAESASQAKTRFLANMSHELRTPLNAVLGAAQLLRAESADPESQAQLVDAIQRSGTGLLGLIENILDLSRIEAGELRLRPVDFHLAECFDLALASTGLAAQAKGLRLACIVDPALHAWRRGDAELLRQIVMNLLGNAVKFTRQGEIVVRVTAGAAPGTVRVCVSDTGVGIDDRALAHIFDPFRQADEGADRRYGGSGLGLAIVRQTVDAMGGHIAVSSRVGEGSRFDFQLPLPPAAAAAAVPAPLGYHVVFHEPHGASADALQAQLQRLGCTGRRCASVAEVQAALQTAPPGVQPWLLLSAEAPDRELLIDTLAEQIEPSHLIVMSDRIAHDAESLRDARRLPRQLSRPVTRAALVSRMAADAPSEPGALQVPQGLLSQDEFAALPHVLVVEDDELNRTLVTRLLQHAGYRVSTAGDGPQALALLRRADRVDLVLMDWQMPVMDGLEATRRLRAGEAGAAGRDVPIVALTANAFAEDRDACLAAGMDDFLTKPVQAVSLITVVERLARPRAGAGRPRGDAVPPPPDVAAVGAPATAPAFDPGVLARLPMVADGSAPEYVQELLQMFLDGCAAALPEIEAAAAARDAATVQRLLHTLKSGSASVGALELAALAAEHETRLRNGGRPPASLAHQLREAFQRLRLALPAAVRSAATPSP